MVNTCGKIKYKEWFTKERRETFIMALLNYDVLKKSGYDGYILEDAPVKVLSWRGIPSCICGLLGLILAM